jgi:hypothetical protein
VLIGIVFLLMATGFCAWWLVRTRLSDEERPFVGTWRLESPVFPVRPELIVELDLMPDGTMRDRLWDSQTGAVEHEQLRPGRWQVLDGRFQEVIGGSSLPRWLGGGNTTLGWDHAVTWDGPDRFRLDGSSASRPSMIWSRCDRAGSR